MNLKNSILRQHMNVYRLIWKVAKDDLKVIETKQVFIICL